MTTPLWAWLIWLASFLILEGIGLFDGRKGGTLSELVWAVFRVRDRRPTALTWTLRAILAAFMVWLSGHFVFGIWTL